MTRLHPARVSGIPLTLRNERITTMDILVDPARLGRLDLTHLDARP
jgi:hypothetical protein